MSKVELFEDQRAFGYDQFVQIWIPNYNYFMDQLPCLFQSYSNKSILVVGCGTGAEILRFVQSSPNWKITGIDPSPDMIFQAKQNLKSYKNVELL